MGAPNRVRYEVLRRDNYTCQYCGAKAPDVPLDVDAVMPGVLGGNHKDPANLITACKPCNGGKSSSHPDAPFVAGVPEDALRWARAVKFARAQMLAEMDARDARHDQFTETWGKWACGYGQQRRAYPRPSGWQDEIDQLVAAGLPFRVLEECIALSMDDWQVSSSEKFRHMCKLAWKKASEVQAAARALWEADGEGDWRNPARDAARREFAGELLGMMRERDSAWYLDDARDHLGEDNPEVREAAARSAFFEAVRLLPAVRQLFSSMEDAADWLDQAHEKLYEKHGLLFSDVALYSVACQIGARKARNLPVGELVP